MIQDVREGKPSASAFGDDVSCPGRRNLLATLPSEEMAISRTPDDADADRGQKIHKAWQSGVTIELEEDELVDYTTGLKYIDDVIAAWMSEHGLSTIVELPREERLWLHDDNLIPVLSGQMDRWYRSGKYLLVIDGKSGWGTYVPASNRSWQLRCYAVLGWTELEGIEHVRVAFVKPKERAEPTDYTDYDTAALAHSRSLIFYYLWFIKDPDAPRYPGVQCRFCLAKTHCPQAGAYSLLPSVVAAHAVTETDINVAVSKLQPVDLVKLWRSSNVVIKILEAAKIRLKAMPAEQLETLGLKLGKPKTLDPIVNTKAAFDAMRAINVSEDALFMALKFSKGELAKVLRRECGFSDKGSPQWIRENLSNFIEDKKADAPLEHIAG